MKTCFIEQTCGLGDILLSIKIANHFATLGHKIVWPVETVYNHISEYVSAPAVKFVDVTTDFEGKGVYQQFVSDKKTEITETDQYVHVPLKNSFFSQAGQAVLAETKYHDLANMHGKFKMCSIDHDNWQDEFTIVRNHEQEDKLFQALNLEGRQYHLINKNFGTPPQWREVLNHTIVTPSGMKEVHMQMYEEFTAFDWLKVFEKAAKIDTVSTSTFYLFEKIDLKCAPTIYSRNTPHRSDDENFGWLKQFARKTYLFIG